MKQPSKKAIQVVKDAEQKRISDMYKVSVNALDMVKKYTDNLLPKIVKSKRPNKYYKQIEDYLTAKYGDLFTQYKDDILNALNQSGIEQLHLIEATLGQPPALITPIVLYKTLPKTKEFEITNRILSKRSSLAYSKKLANNVTSTIAKSFDKGESVQQVSKKIDILLGFRDKEGRTTAENLNLIKQGKLSVSNGALAKSKVIARTEITRMSRISAYRVYESVDIPNKRMKYRGTSDRRSRNNSIVMDGQISDKNATFLYPNGQRYKMFEAPAMYSINDRCSQYLVVLD